MKNMLKQNKAITLIALVITIVILIILASVLINLTLGTNGIITRTKLAKKQYEYSCAKQILDVRLLGIKAVCIADGTEYTLEHIAEELNSENEKEIEIVHTYESTPGTIDALVVVVKAYPNFQFLIGKEDGVIKIIGVKETESGIPEKSSFDDVETFEKEVLKLKNGESKEKTLRDIYDDNLIGQKITYEANGVDDWIIFGKDSKGNILITTEVPVNQSINLLPTAENWVKYETNLNNACSGYGATIQGKTVQSRSIKMEDIDYVMGVKAVDFECEGKTINTREFSTFTIGTGTNELNTAYPVLEGGISEEDENEPGYWKIPKSTKEKELIQNTYGFLGGSRQMYSITIPNGSYQSSYTVNLTDIGFKAENLQYVIGYDNNNTTKPYFGDYLVATKTARVFSDGENIEFYVAGVHHGIGVWSDLYLLCGSSPSSYWNAGSYSYDENGEKVLDDWNGEGDDLYIRPVVELPGSLKVIEVEGGRYDLAE